MTRHIYCACFETRFALLSMRNVAHGADPQPEEQRAALRLEGRTKAIP